MGKRKDDEDLSIARTQDRTDRHTTDIELRERGFEIYLRPRKGEPVWKRNGRLYPQSAAEREIGTTRRGEK